MTVLMVLAALAWGGWWLWQSRTQLGARLTSQDAELRKLDARASTLESQDGELATRLADQSRLIDRNGTDIATLQTRIEATLALMSRVSDELSGGRTRFRLAAIEHLLLLANDRVLLERDVRAAIAALDGADARIAELSDPQLHPVREALARERAALRAVPVPDLASAALTLASLIERAPQLPLASHSPSQFRSPELRQPIADGTDETSGWRRLLAAVKMAAGTLFTIRREDNTRALRLLPPESEAIVYQVLTLKLEGARVALLSRDTVNLREELRSASGWLTAQFKADDPGVLAAQGEFERLQALDLRPPLPDISGSLGALRMRLDAETGTGT